MDDSKKVEGAQQKITPFQRERVGPLLQEFFNRFPPTKTQEQDAHANGTGNGDSNNQAEVNEENKNSVSDQPAEKRKKI